MEKAVFARPVKQVGGLQQFAVKVSFLTPEGNKATNVTFNAARDISLSGEQIALDRQAQGGLDD